MNGQHRRASRAKHTGRDPLAMYRVLGRVGRFTEAEQTALNLPLRVAYEDMRTGRARESCFHTLATGINIAMICAERIDPLVEQACTSARDALVRVLERHQRTDSWGFDGPGLSEVLQGIEIYEQLTALLTVEQLQQAMHECLRRMNAGLTLEPTGT